MRFFITSKIAERGRFFEVDRRYGLSRDYLQSFVIVSSVIIYLRYPCGLRRRLLLFVVLKFTLGNSEFPFEWFDEILSESGLTLNLICFF